RPLRKVSWHSRSSRRISGNPSVRTLNRAMVMRPAMTASGDAQGTRRRYHPRQTIAAGIGGDRLSPKAPWLSRVRGATRRHRGARANRWEIHMIGRVAPVIYGVASYLAFLCSFLYAVAFTGNYFVPKSIDVGSASGLGQSIL